MVEGFKRKPNISCNICDKQIYRRPSQIQSRNGRAFCSMECYGIFCRKETPCSVCKKPILAGLHKKTCSRICANIQRTGIKYKASNPRNKVKSQQALKLRLLNKVGKKCERCNYKKYQILEIHHVDKNRENNNLENLLLICPNCHREEHLLEKSWLNKKFD